MTTRSDLGRAGEDAAARFLLRCGWSILGRNVRCGRTGEIDIVAERRGLLAFVEVKSRRSTAFGTPGEAVTPRKRARLRSLARLWLMSAQPRASSIRFDVIEVLGDGGLPRINHIEDAF